MRGGKQNKYLIKMLLGGKKREKMDKRYKSVLNVEMWVWNWLKVTKGGNWFSSLILWMDPVRVWQREEK